MSPVEHGEAGISNLVDQARSAVDPFDAVKLYKEVLHQSDDAVVMGEAAELMLQLGQIEEAKKVKYCCASCDTSH